VGAGKLGNQGAPQVDLGARDFFAGWHATSYSTSGEYHNELVNDVIHISETEAASDFAALMACVRAGVEIVIENGERPVLFALNSPSTSGYFSVGACSVSDFQPSLDNSMLVLE
jgi:hypothetical protein